MREESMSSTQQKKDCWSIWKESEEITDRTRQKYGKYAIFAEYIYSKNYYLAVLCHKDPKKEFELFEKSPSVYIKIHYYHLPQSELWERYENLISKVEQNIELSENEALDIAFIPKFISKKRRSIHYWIPCKNIKICYN